MGQSFASQPQQPGIVLVTAGSEAEASTLAHHLIEHSLAACISISPITSIYRWQGSTHREAEWQLVIKTDLRRFEELVQAITQLHSYEVPEIVALPITNGFAPYLDWMMTQTQANPTEAS